MSQYDDLNNIWSLIHKEVKQHWDWVEKRVPSKKAYIWFSNWHKKSIKKEASKSETKQNIIAQNSFNYESTKAFVVILQTKWISKAAIIINNSGLSEAKLIPLSKMASLTTIVTRTRKSISFADLTN